MNEHRLVQTPRPLPRDPSSKHPCTTKTGRETDPRVGMEMGAATLVHKVAGVGHWGGNEATRLSPFMRPSPAGSPARDHCGCPHTAILDGAGEDPRGWECSHSHPSHRACQATLINTPPSSLPLRLLLPTSYPLKTAFENVKTVLPEGPASRQSLRLCAFTQSFNTRCNVMESSHTFLSLLETDREPFS